MISALALGLAVAGDPVLPWPGSPRSVWSGAVTGTAALAGRGALSTNLSWAPWPSTFVRVGVAEAPVSSEGLALAPPTFSWGLGYDDWHPGTLGLQVNNWGPVDLRSGSTLLTGAEADLSYKMVLPKAVGEHLGVTVRLNVPFSRAPGLAASLRVLPVDHLFAQLGARFTPFGDTHWTWTYGLGWDNWHPFSFSLAYYNWGPNVFPQTNFLSNGQLTLTWRWQIACADGTENLRDGRGGKSPSLGAP